MRPISVKFDSGHFAFYIHINGEHTNCGWSKDLVNEIIANNYVSIIPNVAREVYMDICGKYILSPPEQVGYRYFIRTALEECCRG